MAAPSPSLSSNGLAAAAATPPKTTLRGLNKPKCIQCGNVARSRCPFQSCKGCCSRAENPCPIHVLKAAAGSAEKAQVQNTLSSEQKSSEGTSGATTRLSSIRQLSSNFAQFNKLNRPRKPLTIKDAVALNEWRFSKLKEYRDRNIGEENEAFDRYMKNVNLLEEVFSLTSVPEENPGTTTELNDDEKTISCLKLRLRSDPARAKRFRERIREVVNEGLAQLQKPGKDDRVGNQDEQPERRGKRAKREERASALSEIIDKVSKARTEEDLKSCTEMKSKLYHRHPTPSLEVSGDDPSEKNKSLPGFVRRIETGEETLKRIDEQFCSLEQIGGLL
ncbi:PREDICTED: uncharacterized protein LOC104807943 [Tarenaya hassleriana]|uniref:uncharacterized protein LOC104807943 n=1 Tax=Tarenaya hassleriana TaxID=28532 RepID=UPI00053C41AF|nr:PREDICTED: uncharacterized protein LOC104807943 [Tarenaya hassleriana]